MEFRGLHMKTINKHKILNLPWGHLNAPGECPGTPPEFATAIERLRDNLDFIVHILNP